MSKLQFLLSGYVNGQNFRYCCQENSSETHWSSIRFATVTGWRGVISLPVVGPHVFENAQRETVTVNAEICGDVLENLRLPTRAAYACQVHGARRKVATSHKVHPRTGHEGPEWE
jgi:hypothetical protein